ncbi:hypothetical protein BDFB_011049, partial [Asbolus verrucosus]
RSFTTDNVDDLGVNKAAVCGTVRDGTGYSQLNNFCAGLDIPMISEKTYVLVMPFTINFILSLMFVYPGFIVENKNTQDGFLQNFMMQSEKKIIVTKNTKNL